MLLLLIASSNDIITICGIELGSNRPGICVPSGEQKQSGRTHCDVSHGGARFGSLSTVHAFSSDPSAQSGDPLQNSSFSIQSPFPHANLPVSQIGSSVAKSGVASRGSNGAKL